MFECKTCHYTTKALVPEITCVVLHDEVARCIKCAMKDRTVEYQGGKVVLVTGKHLPPLMERSE